MKKLSVLFAFVILTNALQNVFGQTAPYCTTSQLSGTVNLASIPVASWTAVAGGASPALTATDCYNIMNGTNTTTVANFYIPLANGTNINVTNNITINGNFDIPSGSTGDNSTIAVSGSNVTLHVTGNLGDATNNNINYNVGATDKIIVGGTLYGKNSNSFNGSGSISGGTWNVGNGATCGSPCPVTGGFSNCISGGVVNGSFCQNSGALPVLLVSFKGIANNSSVNLTWSTASEINFDYFSLQKSANGKDFNEIAQVKGHGTTNVQQNYKYEDNFPFIGKNYYRLTSVDFDNYQETFKTIMVEYSGEKEFHILPNPSDGSLIKLSFNFDVAGEGFVTIYDNMGSVVGYYPAAANGSISFESHLRSGIYLAKYSSASFAKTDRFLVK